MITVYHWHDGVPDASWGIKDAMIGEDTHYQACYFTGLEKPHYPMPAIPLACAILPDLVQIAEVYWLDTYLQTHTLPMQKAEFELVAEFEKL